MRRYESHSTVHHAKIYAMACRAAYNTARSEWSSLRRWADMLRWRVEDIGVANERSRLEYDSMYGQSIVYPTFTTSPYASPAPSAEVDDSEGEPST